MGTPSPTVEPTPEPTPSPTAEPTPEPTLMPAPAPTPGSSTCTAIPGKNGGATDASCQKCATGYKWWPCNGLCSCPPGGGPSAPTPAPPPPPGSCVAKPG